MHTQCQTASEQLVCFAWHTKYKSSICHSSRLPLLPVHQSLNHPDSFHSDLGKLDVLTLLPVWKPGEYLRGCVRIVLSTSSDMALSKMFIFLLFLISWLFLADCCVIIRTIVGWTWGYCWNVPSMRNSLLLVKYNIEVQEYTISRYNRDLWLVWESAKLDCNWTKKNGKFLCVCITQWVI